MHDLPIVKIYTIVNSFILLEVYYHVTYQSVIDILS
jgi:hypothetical protein